MSIAQTSPRPEQRTWSRTRTVLALDTGSALTADLVDLAELLPFLALLK